MNNPTSKLITTDNQICNIVNDRIVVDVTLSTTSTPPNVHSVTFEGRSITTFDELKDIYESGHDIVFLEHGTYRYYLNIAYFTAPVSAKVARFGFYDYYGIPHWYTPNPGSITGQGVLVRGISISGTAYLTLDYDNLTLTGTTDGYLDSPNIPTNAPLSYIMTYNNVYMRIKDSAISNNYVAGIYAGTEGTGVNSRSIAFAFFAGHIYKYKFVAVLSNPQITREVLI